ncbi:MAG: hypothetical protein JWQ35_2248 [Bacteriovoracaceae bacterium]|nr:hypothetical protein [Bacteriovoracaceae bacterium]
MADQDAHSRPVFSIDRMDSKKLLKIFIFVSLAAILTAVFSGQLFELARGLGNNSPKFRMDEDYFWGVLWALGLGAVIYALPLGRVEKIWLLIFWAFRCVITLGLMLFYEDFYSSLDSYGYLKRGILAQVDSGNFGGAGTQHLDQLLILTNHYLPIHSSYHAIKVIFSFIGLGAVFSIWRASVLFFEKENFRFFLILGFLPSLTFWSSVLGKDPVNFLGGSLYILGVAYFFKNKKNFAFFWILMGTAIACWVRIWSVALFFLPFLLAPIFREFFNRKIPIKSLIIPTLVILLGGFYLDSWLGPIIESFGREYLESLNRMSAGWDGGSTQDLIFNSWGAVLRFLPLGVFTALFRPLPFDVNNAFGILAGLENFILLLFTIRAVFKSSSLAWRDPSVLWCSSFILIWGLFYALVSYHNLGSAFRFHLQVLPFQLLLILFLNRQKSKILRVAELKL